MFLKIKEKFISNMAPEIFRGKPYISASDHQLSLSICKAERPKIINDTQKIK